MDRDACHKKGPRGVQQVEYMQSRRGYVVWGWGGEGVRAVTERDEWDEWEMNGMNGWDEWDE